MATDNKWDRSKWDALPPEERVRQRAAGQAMVDGTHMVPTHTCLKCGGPAVQRYDRLTYSDNGANGEMNGAAITVCRDDDCGRVSVTDWGTAYHYPWCYGRTLVTVVQGPSHGNGTTPMLLTVRQRERTREWLLETAE